MTWFFTALQIFRQMLIECFTALWWGSDKLRRMRGGVVIVHSILNSPPSPLTSSGRPWARWFVSRHYVRFTSCLSSARRHHCHFKVVPLSSWHLTSCDVLHCRLPLCDVTSDELAIVVWSWYQHLGRHRAKWKPKPISPTFKELTIRECIEKSKL